MPHHHRFGSAPHVEHGLLQLQHRPLLSSQRPLRNQLQAILPEGAKTSEGEDFKDKSLRAAAWSALLNRAEAEQKILQSSGYASAAREWSQAIEGGKAQYKEEIQTN